MRKNFKAANEGAAKIKKYAPTKETEFRKLFRNRFKDKVRINSVKKKFFFLIF